ncbi:squamosa promoter binding protein-like 14 [Actinidia rufa]|uniref:Squamosa promoter binding protein-like 14 n=1 Tax=Actinidia rufa TaxID=165716 RepID=A0A7J0EJ80_9ERIC|nr:squamosa promoter binding protein-like 14 [Actinidia rufa]
MEEVGAQVAPPMFMHKNLGGRFHEGHSMTKKRGLPNFHHQQPRLTAGYGWNPNGWDWDNVRFVAKPLESDVLCLGTARSVQSEQRRTSDGEGSGVPTSMGKKSVVEDDESLRLKLGGSLNSSEEPMSKPNKRVRSGSPVGGSYPMCQVDTCREDLSNAKDYHRRHKVCEVHSKSSNALVGKQMQRFCQQCSRFHPLSEFDEGKRSCRRRLAGHNRRRRKTQTEDVSSRILLSGNHNNTHNGDLNIVNLLTVLAQTQGHKEVKSTNCSTLPNKDHLIQILSKIKPLPVDIEAKLPAPGSLGKPVPEQASSDNQNRLNANVSSSSTKDLLAVLSATLASPSPNALAILSQRSSQGNDADDTKLACLNQALSLNMQNGAAIQFPSVGGARSSTSYQSPVEDSDCQVQETRTNLPLQLFSSSPEDDSPPKLACARKYFSSDSSNAIEDSSPSSSPPVAQKLFPMQTTRETEPKKDFHRSEKCIRADNSSFQSLPYQAGYTSSSGSDHSPSSLNSDAQDRTGRMIFKLFGKNPSQLPETLRTQINNWLSHSPSEMESYIRPGCVILSIYLSMPYSAWEQLEANLLRHVNSLVRDSDTDFWRNGRFLLQIGRQLASHKDGEFRLCKSWRAWHSPELISVSPLAVVGGEETSLFLRGRNLNIPGTKIHWTHMGGYLSEEVPGSASQETVYDEISLVSFKIHGVAPGVLGRCFIEVENGFKGTTFPVIIADATICKELRLLESAFGEVERNCCALVKTLLDILLERDLHRGEPSKESLDMLSEIHLLNRAVKRSTFFPPNLVGPGGVTPLHLAACTSSSDDVVDALTGDPQEIGLHCWNSLLDANGLSPYAYALMRNNHSYNSLVARKLADRKNGQVCVSVATEIETQWSGVSQDHHPRPLIKQGQRSCSKCAVVASRYNRMMPVSQGFLHRSYMLSMLAVAAVCVCVCLFLRGHPDVGLVAPFRWENLSYGPS